MNGPRHNGIDEVLTVVLVKDAQLGLAAAMGVVLFAVIFALTIVQWFFFGRQEAA